MNISRNTSRKIFNIALRASQSQAKTIEVGKGTPLAKTQRIDAEIPDTAIQTRTVGQTGSMPIDNKKADPSSAKPKTTPDLALKTDMQGEKISFKSDYVDGSARSGNTLLALAEKLGLEGSEFLLLPLISGNLAESIDKMKNKGHFQIRNKDDFQIRNKDDFQIIANALKSTTSVLKFLFPESLIVKGITTAAAAPSDILKQGGIENNLQTTSEKLKNIQEVLGTIKDPDAQKLGNQCIRKLKSEQFIHRLSSFLQASTLGLSLQKGANMAPKPSGDYGAELDQLLSQAAETLDEGAIAESVGQVLIDGLGSIPSVPLQAVALAAVIAPAMLNLTSKLSDAYNQGENAKVQKAIQEWDNIKSYMDARLKASADHRAQVGMQPKEPFDAFQRTQYGKELSTYWDNCLNLREVIDEYLTELHTKGDESQLIKPTQEEIYESFLTFAIDEGGELNRDSLENFMAGKYLASLSQKQSISTLDALAQEGNADAAKLVDAYKKE